MCDKDQVCPGMVTLEQLKILAEKYDYHASRNYYIATSREELIFEVYSVHFTTTSYCKLIPEDSLFYLGDIRTRDNEQQIMYVLFDPKNKVTWNADEVTYWELGCIK